MDHVFGSISFVDELRARAPAPGDVSFAVESRSTLPSALPLHRRDEVPDPHTLADPPVRDREVDELQHQRHGSESPRCLDQVTSVHTSTSATSSTPAPMIAASARSEGDQVELEVAGLERLRINIRDELKRHWERATQLQRQERDAIRRRRRSREIHPR